jgi:hypothetical protein
MLETGYRLLVSGLWSLIMGFRLLVNKSKTQKYQVLSICTKVGQPSAAAAVDKHSG